MKGFWIASFDGARPAKEERARMSEKLEPWQWRNRGWRGHVDHVRAGRKLIPAWPDNARVAVAISFDSDHETIPLREGETSPGKLSQGEYGSRVAVPRILRLLDHFSVPASFFMPAVSALLHPDEACTYRSRWSRASSSRVDPRAQYVASARGRGTAGCPQSGHT